jgi:DNA-binding MarR family transcriptional regulator
MPRSRETTPDGEPAFSPAVALVTAARDVEVRLAALLEPHALTLRKYAVLQRIATTPGLSLADLARGARSTERGVATIVRALVDSGWARAGSGPGGLPAQVTATRDGIALLDRLRREIAELDGETFATPAGELLADALAGVDREARPQGAPED